MRFKGARGVGSERANKRTSVSLGFASAGWLLVTGQFPRRTERSRDRSLESPSRAKLLQSARGKRGIELSRRMRFQPRPQAAPCPQGVPAHPLCCTEDRFLWKPQRGRTQRRPVVSCDRGTVIETGQRAPDRLEVFRENWKSARKRRWESKRSVDRKIEDTSPRT